ncbi:MAG: hypothetical protein NVS4B8_06040 [Herpetosiphon sp.]
MQPAQKANVPPLQQLHLLLPTVTTTNIQRRSRFWNVYTNPVHGGNRRYIVRSLKTKRGK